MSRKFEPVYPFHFDPADDFREFRRDVQGVPLVYYAHLRRWEQNPITVAQYGLAQLAGYARTQAPEAAALSRTMADWLVDHQEEWHHEIGAWVYHYSLPFYGPTSPWISAMAQGQGISLLLRCGANPHYEHASRRAVRAFFHPVKEGGVQQRFPDGTLGFEEYPTTVPSLVLNGLLFALLGLWDYARYFGDARVQQLFEEGLAGAKANLARYDTGYWNLYDLHPSRRLASANYVGIHVRLLEIFAELTGDEHFARTARRWQGYLHHTACRMRFHAGKVLEKIRLQARRPSSEPA